MAIEKPGKALEKLVASLEKALAKNPNVTVHLSKRQRDRTTGKLREHDVVLDLKEVHHSVLIAIECRDRSRPIGVPEVEAFYIKCQETGIDQGIIVSTKGFCNTARTKATKFKIRCLDIEESENFDWLLAPGVHTTTTHLLNHDWKFFPVKDGVVEQNEFEVLDSNGNVLTMDTLSANAQNQLTQLLPKPQYPVEENTIDVKFSGGEWILRNTNTGETVPVNFAIARIRYSVKQELVPFQLVQYQAKDGDGNITDAAYADIKLGDKETRLMIVYKDGEGGSVWLSQN